MTAEAPPGPAPRGSARSGAALVAGVVVLALVTGALPLLGLPALVLPGLLLAGLLALGLLRAPDATLAVATVAVLLPAGLLPPLLQSALDVATILLAATAATLAGRSDRAAGPAPAALWLLAAYVLWSLLTLWWSDSPSAGTDLLRRYAVALALLVVLVHRSTRRETLERVLGALAVAGWILVAAGLFAIATESTTRTGRLAVFEMNPNQLGNVLLLTTPGVLWRAVAPGRGTPRRSLEAVAFLAASLVIIGQSGSRGSLLAYAILLVAFAATRTLRRWGVSAALVALCALVAAPSAFASVIDRLQEGDPTQLSRTVLWGSGLSLIADHPFGVGVGSGPSVMPQYINARVSRDHFRERETLPAHNPLIEVGADTGLVGAALYGSAVLLAAGGLIVAVARARRRRDAYWTAYGAVVGSCSLAFLAVWWKSGGESYSFTTFLLLGLWIGGARACRHELDLVQMPDPGPGAPDAEPARRR